MMSSLVSVKARRPEKGSAWSMVSRARWTAARWSRAEQKLSKKPVDESLERTRATAFGVKARKSGETPEISWTVAGSEDRSQTSSIMYDTAHPGSME
eukprot:1728415-Pleurochrysis_carterae.AAC.1